MPVCTHHPAVEATESCISCRRPFCASCLVDLVGRRYCAPCRDYALAQLQAAGQAGPAPSPSFADHLVPSRNVNALVGYYLGVFSLIPCVGLALGPAAIVLGAKGLRARRENPGLPGRTHAITAIVLGSLTSALYWGVLLLALVGGLLSRPGG